MRATSVFLLPLLTAIFGLLPAGRAEAQIFSNLYSFTATSGFAGSPQTNGDGTFPESGLIVSGSTLYGTAGQAGATGNGTVFALNSNGLGFTNLHNFPATVSNSAPNSDGASPFGLLVLSANTLYGTAIEGGLAGNGSVYRVNTNGSAFTNLHSFTAISGSSGTNSDGAGGAGGLVLSGTTLYGPAYGGGSSGSGVVFKINTDGTGFSNVYNFTAASGSPLTNGDGAHPFGELTVSGNTLYGAARYGGGSGNGTIFRVNTDGSSFTNLHNFLATSGTAATNSDGANPHGVLALSGSTLYGTAQAGGTSGHGVIFRVNTDGTGFTNLHNFTAVVPNNSTGTNGDGATPYAALVLSGNILYGAAAFGGSTGRGTAFCVNADGTGFRVLYHFTRGASLQGPIYPYAGMALSGNTLYGTTFQGGAASHGTVFSLIIQPQLGISASGANVVLTWPTNSTGFTLQSTASLGPSPVWNAVSPAPVVTNGLYTVTNAISGMPTFYRLSQ